MELNGGFYYLKKFKTQPIVHMFKAHNASEKCEYLTFAKGCTFKSNSQSRINRQKLLDSIKIKFR
jgi:hypothetical protein